MSNVVIYEYNCDTTLRVYLINPNFVHHFGFGMFFYYLKITYYDKKRRFAQNNMYNFNSSRDIIFIFEKLIEINVE